MGRPNYKTVRHNTYIRNTGEGAINSEQIERNRAARKEAKEASIEFKTEFAQRKCIQNIYKYEKAWQIACKQPDLEKSENARIELLRAIDKAAADSIGRILAEIKQVYLNSKELLTVEVSVDVFYADFKNFCKKNFVNYFITEEEMNKILKPYIEQNLLRIKKLGERFDYNKPAEKFVENIEIVKKASIKEKELTI